MQYFVSGCVGIELVGVVTALRSLSLVLASILSGKIIMYVSRTGLGIATMMFTMTLLYIMLFWERESSYVVVFLLAIGLGAGNGSLTSIAAGEHNIIILLITRGKYSAYDILIIIYIIQIVWVCGCVYIFQ